MCVGTTYWGYQTYGGLDDVRYAVDDRELRQQLDQATELDQAIDIVQAGIDRFAAPERFYLLGQLLEQTGDLAAAYTAYSRARELAELDQPMMTY